MLKKFNVKITQAAGVRKISVLAASSIDALLTVMHSINPNEPSRVVVSKL